MSFIGQSRGQRELTSLIFFEFFVCKVCCAIGRSATKIGTSCKEAWTRRTVPAADENFATNWVDWAAQLRQVLFYHFLFFS